MLVCDIYHMITEAVQTVGSIVVVVMLISALLHSMCDLKA